MTTSCKALQAASNRMRALCNFNSSVEITPGVWQKLRHHTSLPAALNFLASHGARYGHGIIIYNYVMVELIPKGTCVRRSKVLQGYLLLHTSHDPKFLPFGSRAYTPIALTQEQLNKPTLKRMLASHLAKLL
jgi:hypothetical protein